MFEGEIKKHVYDRGKYTRDDIEGDWGSLLPVCEKWHKVGNLRIYDKKDPIRERYDTHGVQVCNKGKCEEREDNEKEPARHLIPDQFNSCLVQVFPRPTQTTMGIAHQRQK